MCHKESSFFQYIHEILLYLAILMYWVQTVLVHGLEILFQHTQLRCLESVPLFHHEDLRQLKGLDQYQHTPQPLFDQCHSVVWKLETIVQ